MHIPKTAGSSVSRLFIDYFGADRAIEHCMRGIYRDLDFNTLEFVSGHASPAELSDRLDAGTYTFTLLREPVDQLISHLNWVKRLVRPEYRQNFEQNTPEIQAVALSLADLELSDPEAVDHYLKTCQGKARQLFLNAQSRYFLPRDTDCTRGDLSLGVEAVRKLNNFDAIGRLEDAERVIRRVALDNHLADLGLLPRENVSHRKENFEGGKEAWRLLASHMRLDMLLYEVAWKRGE